MKKAFFLILLLALFTSVFAVETITIESFPETIDEFIIMRNELAQTPEGAAACFVVALIKYTQDSLIGKDFLTAILINDGSQLQTSQKGYGNKEPNANAMFLIHQIDDDPWTAYSYIYGTYPENQYSLPALPWKVETMRNAYSEIDDETVKVFVFCSGADSPRPITLARNNRGIWKAKEWSSLVVGIRPPVESFDDDL